MLNGSKQNDVARFEFRRTTCFPSTFMKYIVKHSNMGEGFEKYLNRIYQDQDMTKWKERDMTADEIENMWEIILIDVNKQIFEKLQNLFRTYHIRNKCKKCGYTMCIKHQSEGICKDKCISEKSNLNLLRIYTMTKELRKILYKIRYGE